MNRVLATLSVLLCLAAPTFGEESPTNFPVVTMKSGQGLVLLRVINTRDVGGFPKWQFLTLRNTNPGGREERLTDRYMYSLQSSVFTESMAPGDYEPVLLGATLPGFGSTYSASVNFPKGFRFKVEAGRLTDLGTLYNLRAYAPVETDLYKIVHAGDRDLARSYSFMFAPEQAQKLLEEPLGWRLIPEVADPSKLTNKTRRLSMALNGRQLAPDGSSLFGELFGQIARRSPAGDWTWEETGLTETILGVAETADGNIYAVAEHSTLIQRDSQGQWVRIPVPRVGALPCHISAEPDGSLLTAWEDRGAISVYSYQPKDSSPWKLRTTISLGKGANDGRAFQRCAVLMSEPRLVVVTFDASKSGTKFGYHVFDKEKETWTTHRPEEFQGEVGLTPDGMMFALAGWKPGQQFKITNLASSWQRLSKLDWSIQPTFRDGKEGYLLHIDNGPRGWAWVMKRETSLWRTMDGGKNWTRHAGAPEHAARFLLLARQDILFQTWDGKIYVSHDNGVTSMLERDSSGPLW